MPFRVRAQSAPGGTVSRLKVCDVPEVIDAQAAAPDANARVAIAFMMCM
jgi:hypothetical protein